MPKDYKYFLINNWDTEMLLSTCYAKCIKHYLLKNSGNQIYWKKKLNYDEYKFSTLKATCCKKHEKQNNFIK